MKTKSLFFLLLLSLFWGFGFQAIRVGVQSVPPLTLASGRVFFATLVMLIALRAKGLRLPPFGRVWAALALVGALNVALPYQLVFLAETEISAGLAATLFSTMPLFTVVIAHWWQSEQLTPQRLGAVVTGFVGVLVVLWPSLAGGDESSLLGAAAVLLASAFTAASLIFIERYLDQWHPLQLIGGMLLCAMAITLPVALLADGVHLAAITPVGLTAMIFLGVFSSAINFILYFWLLDHRGPTFASLSRFTVPPVAVLLTAIFEVGTLRWTTVAGMLLIMLCIAIMNGYFDRFSS